MSVKINWSQLETREHKQGMRMECSDCGAISYHGDSPSGDLEVHKAKKEHTCLVD